MMFGWRKKRLESKWGIYGIDARTVNAYIAKNDAVELNVPLQIVRGLVEELMTKEATSENETEITLATNQGMLKAYYKVALRLRELVRDAETMTAAGGIVK